MPEIINTKDLKNTNMVPTELKEQFLKDLDNNLIKNTNYQEIKIINTIAM